MSFRRESGQWVVDGVSKESTGYCPDISSWQAVVKAPEAAGIEHPCGFTHEVASWRRPARIHLIIAREHDFVCVGDQRA